MPHARRIPRIEPPFHAGMSEPDEPSLLRQRAFMRFWFARLFGTAANQMLMVAIGWQMYDLTHSAWDLGLVGLLQFLPALLLVLVAGHAADRFHRARMLALCLVAQAVIAGLLALSTWQGWTGRTLLLALSVGLGIVKAFQMPSQQSLTPSLVSALLLPRALAFASAGTQGAIVVGPALGGFVYVAGAGAVHALCGVLFAASAALAAGVRYDHAPRAGQRISLELLLGGVRFVAHRPVVLGAISLDLFAMLLGGVTALLPIYAKDILMTGPWGLGLLRSAPALGALAVSIALSRRQLERHVGRILFMAVGAFGAATIAFALSTSIVVSIVALAIYGAGDAISVVIRHSLVQTRTPNEMLGRVLAVNFMFTGTSGTLGEFRAGAIAALFGAFTSVLIGGVGAIVVALLWMKLFPEIVRINSIQDNGKDP